MQVNRQSFKSASMLVLAVLAFCVGFLPASAQAWSDLTPASRIGTDEDLGSGGLVVSDGRVWWLTDVDSPAYGHPTTGAELRSRALAGGPTRRTPLDIAAMQRPCPVDIDTEGVPSILPGFAQFRMREGRVFVTGLWGSRSQPVVQPTSYVGFLAAFDARSGSLLREDTETYQASSDEHAPGLPRFVSGNPAVLGSPVQPVGSDQLRDPWTGGLFGARAQVTAAPKVNGRFLLAYANKAGSEDAWSRGRGSLRVLDLASGRVRYRLTAGAVNRVAGARKGSSVAVSLREDGSLTVAVGRTGKGVRPVAVDPRGRVRRIGRPIVGVRSVVATIGHGRAFVLADVKRTVGSKTAYQQRLWITDSRARRGRVVPVIDRLHASVSSTPFFWDGRHAVYETIGPRDQSGVRVDGGLSRLRLRTGEVPSRWRP